MEITIDFPGGSRVDAHLGSFTIATDQPQNNGGENTAPTPFSLFFAALGACAGFYVLSFCRERNIPTVGIRLIERTQADASTRMIRKVIFEIQLPEDFPVKYASAVLRAAEQCVVKKHLEAPPDIEFTASRSADSRATEDGSYRCGRVAQ